MEEAEKVNSASNIPTLIIANATSAYSRLRSWLLKSPEKEDDGADVIENKHASIPLKSILKKEGKRKSTENHVEHSGTNSVEAVTDLGDYNTKRRERTKCTLRRGPSPVEELSISKRGPSVLTHATLNPNFQKKQNGKSTEKISFQGCRPKK